MTATSLDRLAEQYGIGYAYHDYRGELKPFSTATRIALLRAMGVDTTGIPALPITAETRDSTLATGFPRVLVIQQGDPVVFAVPASALGSGPLAWTFETEGGASESGTLGTPGSTQDESRTPHDEVFTWVVPLRHHPDLGYHRMTIRASTGEEVPVRLIVAPARCYEPEALQNQKRLWGITLQLYTLRSSTNWGIGDFGDLMELIELVAPLGCGLIGLNPLHALFPADAEHNSPYSPSSRQFLNPLYVCLPRIPEAQACRPLQSFLRSDGVEVLERIRATPNVDYLAVAALKLHWMRILHQEFRLHHLSAGTERARSFQRFVSAGGDALRLHAVFDALHLHLKDSSAATGGWPGWPAHYRDPASAAVARFVAEHEGEVEFQLYLQWLAAEQL
ncbi:MAG: hypothetical protein RLZZ403_813, partial [Pseudomonadota bacterium]